MRGLAVLLVASALGNSANFGDPVGFGQRFDNELTRLVSGRAGANPMAQARLEAHARRFDSIVADLRTSNPEAARRVDSAWQVARAGSRRDAGGAASASAGFHFARQLEYIYADVLREDFPTPNAWDLFPIDSTVPVGARTHTVRRIYSEGDAAVYRGGQTKIPRVQLSQKEEQFPVRHYVTSFVYSLFEQLSSAFANTALVAELLRVARDVLMEFANQKVWYGDPDNGIYGVLNYKWLPKKIVATPFDGTASPDDVIAALNALGNFPAERSKSRMRPDTFVTSTRVKNYLMNTPRSSNTDTTIGRFWLDNNSLGIKQIQDAWELQGKGPGGTDGALFYRRDRLGICNVVVQNFTTLPVQSLGFEDTTFAYMSHGGVIMRDVGNNILGWVNAG